MFSGFAANCTRFGTGKKLRSLGDLKIRWGVTDVGYPSAFEDPPLNREDDCRIEKDRGASLLGPSEGEKGRG